MQHDFVLRHVNNMWYGVFSHLAEAGVQHGISTRFGGVSKAPYNDLNLALHVGDDLSSVLQNRKLFCQALNINEDHIVTAKQVHDTKVEIVNEAYIGKGSKSYEEAIDQTDALVTNQSQIPLFLFFADCTPVLIADPVKSVVAVVHAGWKGTVQKIAQLTVKKMQQIYGSKPEDCLIGIGPSIGPCCYEVDDTVVRELRKNFTYWEELVTPQADKWRFNMWQTNRRQLLDIGVRDKNIVIAGVCTQCHNNIFFSYRADKGVTGRMGAFIMLS